MAVTFVPAHHAFDPAGTLQRSVTFEFKNIYVEYSGYKAADGKKTADEVKIRKNPLDEKVASLLKQLASKNKKIEEMDLQITSLNKELNNKSDEEEGHYARTRWHRFRWRRRR